MVKWCLEFHDDSISFKSKEDAISYMNEYKIENKLENSEWGVVDLGNMIVYDLHEGIYLNERVILKKI